jgi:hypothetical protein
MMRLLVPRGRVLAGAVAAGLSAAGAIIPLNLPPVGGALVAAVIGCAALTPVRAMRTAAYLVAALLGALFALTSVLLYYPQYVAAVGALAGGAALSYTAWRDALSTRARWWDRAIAAFVSASAVYLFIRMLLQVGSEGGFCWIPGLPVGCLP